MPRARSSGSRSVLTPVSASTSDGLAVVDVPGRAERRAARLAPSRSARARASAAAHDEVDLDLGDRARVEQHGVRRARAPRSAGRRARSRACSSSAPTARGVTATTGPSSSSSGSAPPPARPAARTMRTVAAAPARLPRCRRAAARRAPRAPPRGGAQHLQHRDVAAARSGSRCRRSVASSAASESLSIRTARASGCARMRSIAVAVPDDDPGLRTAEQLVAGEADDVGAAPRCSSRAAGSSREHALRARRPRRASTPEPRSSITGSPRRRASAQSSGSGASSVKPTVRKFDACTRISAAVSGPIARS